MALEGQLSTEAASNLRRPALERPDAGSDTVQLNVAGAPAFHNHRDNETVVASHGPVLNRDDASTVQASHGPQLRRDEASHVMETEIAD